jgi:hypothetical protein
MDRNKEEAAMSKKRLDEFTRDQYLARRAAGESRTKIMRSLGANTDPFYAKLTEWGLRDKNVELQVLAPLIAAASPAPTPVTDDEPWEPKAETAVSGEQQPAGEPAAEEASPAKGGAEILQRVEQRAADREREIADLQAAVIRWQAEVLREQLAREQEREAGNRMLLELKQQKDVEIARLSGIVTELTEARDKAITEAFEQGEKTAIQIELLEGEKKRLTSHIAVAGDAVQSLTRRLRELEANREGHRGFVFLRVPVQSGENPVRQRVNVHRDIERLSEVMESADSDRGRVAAEFFQLVQTYVALVASELAELHPGCKDVTGFVKSFFGHHNLRHMDDVEERVG